MRETEAEEKLTQRERSRRRAASWRAVRKELKQARKQMARELLEKKALIVLKLRELKSNNKNIEEIYKYTDDIIVEEEEDEEEDGAEERGTLLQPIMLRSGEKPVRELLVTHKSLGRKPLLKVKQKDTQLLDNISVNYENPERTESPKIIRQMGEKGIRERQ
jgi:hypothetical protein